MKRIGYAGLLVVLLVGCSSARPSGRGSSSSSTAFASLSDAAAKTPKAVAVALGRQLLDRVVLPAGSRPLMTPEPAALGGFVPQPGVGNLLFAHRLFTVNEPPYGLWHFLQAHVPRGFTSPGGSSGTIGGVQEFGVEDDLSVLPPNISVAELQLRIVGNAAGAGVVRVDSEVAWTAPRPDDEFVSPRDHVMILSTIHAYESGKPVGKHLIVTEANLVRPIVTAFNSARVEPPAGTLRFRECGYIGLHDIVYRIAFATTATATPDVVATLQCAAISVTVNGRPAPSLQTLSEQAWNDMTHDLGIAEPYPTVSRQRH
jgi:hypothetical protein